MFELIKNGTIEMPGQCLDDHGSSVPGGFEPGGDGSDGWSTIGLMVMEILPLKLIRISDQKN